MGGLINAISNKYLYLMPAFWNCIKREKWTKANDLMYNIDLVPWGTILQWRPKSAAI